MAELSRLSVCVQDDTVSVFAADALSGMGFGSLASGLGIFRLEKEPTMATDTPMQLGMVGLGRMGANIVRRLMRDGHSCVGYDVNSGRRQGARGRRRVGRHSLADFAAKLDAPRAVWVMVPAGEITDKTIGELAEVLEAGDIIIDGGNTHYHDDIRHAARAPRARASITSTAAPAAGSGAWSAATA